MRDYQDFPLSPPKYILKRLIHFKLKASKPAPERKKLTSLEKKTLPASEVQDKVLRLPRDHQEEIQRRQLKITQELDKTVKKSDSKLTQISKHAKRFIQNDKIWNKFKFKVDVFNDKELVTSNSVIKFDKTDTQIKTFKIPKVEFLSLLENSESIFIIVKYVNAYLRKKRCLKIPFFYNHIDEQICNLSFEEIIYVIISKTFCFKIRSVLLLLRAPGNYKSKELPIETTITSALLYISSARHHQGHEKLHSAKLGKAAIRDYGRYALPHFIEYHYHDDDFYNYLVSKFFRDSMKLLSIFRYVIKHGFKLYDVNHLKFLRSWRIFNDSFNLFHVFHSHRLLLLALTAVDNYESHLALNSIGGVINDSSITDKYKRLNDDAQKMKKVTIFYRSCYKDVKNHWFTIAESLKEKVENLYKQYENFRTSADIKSFTSIIIPPGFSLLEWRKFRLYDILDKANKKQILKTGLKSTLKDEYSVERSMSRAGVKTFRAMIEDYKDEAGIKDMNDMLISATGFKLNKEQDRIISNYKDPEYIEKSLLIIKSLTKINFRITNDLKSYFKTWRRLMNIYTRHWIQKCIKSNRDLVAFEIKIFNYNLFRSFMSIEDFIDYDLKLEVPKRRVSFNLTLVEFVLKKFRNDDKIRLRTFEVIRDDLEETFNKLKDNEDSLIVLWSLSDDLKYKKCLIQSYCISPETATSLDRFKLLIDINLHFFHDFYRRLEC